MKPNFSKITHLFYQEDERSELSVQTLKFPYIAKGFYYGFVCAYWVQTSFSSSCRFPFFKCIEIIRTSSHNNILFFHLRQPTDVLFCFG
jgi:hypothetical protein